MLSKDGGKLSKRKGDVAVEDFLENGYLPEALINFIGLIILSVPDKSNEILDIKELIKMFDWDKVHKNPAILDTDKLDWISLAASPIAGAVFFPEGSKMIFEFGIT